MIKILTKSNERLYKPAERMENNCYIPNLHGIGISEDNCGINRVKMLRKECGKKHVDSSAIDMSYIDEMVVCRSNAYAWYLNGEFFFVFVC